MRNIFILLLVLFCIPYHIPIKNTANFVLISLDGVRWQEVFNGTDALLYSETPLSSRQLMPNTYNYFMDHGVVIGKESTIISSGPNHISLPGYLEITRGYPSTDCQSNDCANLNLSHSIINQFNNPVVFSSWDHITRVVPVGVYSNCGYQISDMDEPTHVLERDIPGYRSDYNTWMAARSYLYGHSPDLLWVSFGNTDEYAHLGDYQKYLQALREVDKYVGELIKILDNGRTTFIITTDHGRNIYDFKNHGSEESSAKVWMMIYGNQTPIKDNEIKSLSDIYSIILNK